MCSLESEDIQVDNKASGLDFALWNKNKFMVVIESA